MTAPAKGTALLAVLTEHANNDWVCPSIPRLAVLTGLTQSTVSDYLRKLRQSGDITSRLVHVKPHGQARVVTITASGKSTRTPVSGSKRLVPERPAFTPSPEHGCPVRVLTGAEFKRRAAELEAREAEARRKREMAL